MHNIVNERKRKLVVDRGKSFPESIKSKLWLTVDELLFNDSRIHSKKILNHYLLLLKYYLATDKDTRSFPDFTALLTKFPMNDDGSAALLHELMLLG